MEPGDRRSEIFRDARRPARPGARSRLYSVGVSSQDSKLRDWQFINDLVSRQSLSGYKYTRLKEGEIRILRLQDSKSRDNEIHCELETIRLNDPNRPAYDALSYTWGGDEAIWEIKVQDFRTSKDEKTPAETTAPSEDSSQTRSTSWRRTELWKRGGGMSSKNFYITSNLKEALRSFREKDEVLMLWVDAICINQKDIEEKNEQVSRMAEIYGQADAVRVWLGNETDDSEMAIKHIIAMQDLPRLDSLVETKYEKKFVSETGKDARPARWYALATLIRRPWFTRRWVVQELALAKEAWVYVGEEKIHWDMFAEAVSLFARESDRVAQLFESSPDFFFSSASLGDTRATGASSIVQTTNNLFRTSDGHRRERLTGLESLVASLLTFETRDPRDIIYALLAVAKDVDHPNDAVSSQMLMRSRTKTTSFEADYTKTVLEVYTEFVAFCIKTSSSLDIVCRQWAPSKARRELTPEERQRNLEEGSRERAKTHPEITFQLPSWIGLLSKSPFGLPSTGTFASTAAKGDRIAADGLVGPPGRRHYNASLGTVPVVEFGEADVGVPIRGGKLPRQDYFLFLAKAV